MKRCLSLLLMLALLTIHRAASSPDQSQAKDWPMWRHDAQRTAASDLELAPELHLQWSQPYPPQKTAWLDQPHMVYDRNPEPIILGKTLFFGSARNDCLTALDTRTGAEKWAFYTDGPIRFAPTGWEGKVYFVSDDGYLYCVNAESGKLLWKFRGGPSDQHGLGNGRLISTWPARGAPVVVDGKVYFAASIWPFMGIFIHALDANTGNEIWTNDGDGYVYTKQPHNADSFAGVAPQGPLLVQEDKLLIPGGRSVPACYDRKTGKLLHFRLADNGKFGGPEVAVLGTFFFNGGAIFDLPTGSQLGPFGKQPAPDPYKSSEDGMKTGANLIPIGQLPVLAKDLVVGYSSGKLQAFDPRECKTELVESKDTKGNKTQRVKFTMAPLDTYDAPGKVETLIRSGSRLYAASRGKIEGIELPLPKEKGKKPTVSWQAPVTGTPVSLCSGDDRLFAVTLEGRILCFGSDKVESKTLPAKPEPKAPAEQWVAKARSILETTKARDGYCLVWGIGSGQLVRELARQSNLQIIGIDPDANKVEHVRLQLIAAGLYGERVAVHVGDPASFSFPPYLASLAVLEDANAGAAAGGMEFVPGLFRTLRPYGGVACLELRAEDRAQLLKLSRRLDLAGAKIEDKSGLTLLSRDGGLPGAGNWTHENADAANTRVSSDRLVKAPMGLLWFGGSSNEGVLPRHGHGPQPQVIDGRLLIEGLDMLRAMDIYTGRVLWEAKLPGVGKIYNNLAHQPGANATGSNYVSTADSVYIVHGKSCVRLDIATGKKISEFRMPAADGSKGPPEWGYVNVSGNYLIGTANPLVVDPKDDALPRQLQLWNVDERKLTATLEGHTDQVTGVVFSPDGKSLATTSGDKTVQLWDVATAKSRGTLLGHTKRLTSVAFAPDGKMLATGAEDNTVILWDLASKKPKATLNEHTGLVTCVAFSPDGKMLATGSTDSTVNLWDLATEKLLASLEGISDDVTCLAFSPDGKTLATGSADKAARLWNVASKEIRFTLEKHKEPINGVAFAPDGKTLATGSRDKTVLLWDATTGQHLATLEGQQSPVTCVAYAPDGKTLAVGTLNATVHLWDVAERKVKGLLNGLPGSTRSVAFSPDSKNLAMGGMEVIRKTPNENLSSSKRLVVMDRLDGKVLWTADALSGFRHNSICIGGDRLYCIDRLSGGELTRLKRRGETPRISPRLLAFDLATGKVDWKSDDDIFGTSLCYSLKHHVLIETGRPAGDTLWDEAKGMRAYKAGEGQVLWYEKSYVGPALLHGDYIIKDQSACDLLTGKPKMREDPITGNPVPWTWTRNHGCNTPIASEYLMTFRSGAAGFCDLFNDGGTGNFGGFRSSCTNNLIVAGGILTAPDYTRSCTCGYQNQTSLALVPMPAVEIWTRFPMGQVRPAVNLLDPEKPPPAVPASGDKAPKPIKHIAFALGAPGHRRADDGRLWLNEYDHLKVRIDSFGYYRGHSSKIGSLGGSWPWVLASGCRGISELELAIKGDGKDAAENSYTIRLHFADPDNDRPGERIFDVTIQSKTVLTQFDIAKAAGGRNRGVVKEFKGIKAVDKIQIQFICKEGVDPTAASVSLLSGLEIVRE